MGCWDRIGSLTGRIRCLYYSDISTSVLGGSAVGTFYRRCFTSDVLQSNVDRRKPVWKVARRRKLVLPVSSNRKQFSSVEMVADRPICSIEVE